MTFDFISDNTGIEYMENSKKDSVSKFSFAMDSLKGILDQEGIIKTNNKDSSAAFIPTLTVDEVLTDNITDLLISSTEEDLPIIEDNNAHPPILDGTITVIDDADTDSIELDAYISDLEDSEFDIVDLHKSPGKLEEYISAITEDEIIPEAGLSPVTNVATSEQARLTKERMQQQLILHIEESLEEFKKNLISSLQNELDILIRKEK